ncbi:MAG: PASTA domain-containing protein, partial [Methanococcaceae archaeon]
KDRRSRIQSSAELAYLLKEKRNIKKIRQIRISTLHSEQHTVKIGSPDLHNGIPKKTKVQAVFQKPKIANASIIKEKSNLVKVIISGIIALIALMAVMLLYNSSKTIKAVEEDTNLHQKGLSTSHPSERIINENRDLGDLKQLPQKLKDKVEITPKKKSETLIEVPDVTGLNKTLAERILSKYGLNTGGVLNRTSTAENSGLVIQQGLPAGTRVKKGTRVNLIIGE